MWWPILQSLAEHLKADPALSGLQVNYGMRNPIPDVDAVDVRFGGAPAVNLHDGDEGDVRLWLDVAKKLADADADTAADTGVAYQQLHALTDLVLASVNNWWKTTADISGATFKTEVAEMMADGEELRDYGVAGARIVLNINWRQEA